MNLKQRLITLLVRQAFRSGLILPLALTIEKAEWDKLDKAVQAMYKEKDGKYQLDVEIEDNSGLKSALSKERERANKAEKAARELTERFEGIDLDQVKAMLHEMDQSEEGKLLKAGKFEEAFTKRTEKLRAEYEKKLLAKDVIIEGHVKANSGFKQLVVDNEIRAAASKAGVHAHAVDDALYRGRQIFTVAEGNKVIKLNGDGHPVYGKDGKTPYSPGEWVEEMKKDAPHWFPNSNSGSGAGGNNKDSTGKRIVKRAEFEAMDPTARMAVVKEQREGKTLLQD